MSWEAFRLTSKSPSELLATLGSHGVDDLFRQAFNAVWRDFPVETRTYDAVERAIWEVFSSNMRVWAKIKKPTPEAFFQDMPPTAAGGFMRQASVLCWMMLPRTGGRNFASTHGILTRIFERNMTAWGEDHATFTGRSKTRSPKKTSPRKLPARTKRSPFKSISKPRAKKRMRK